MNIPGLPRERRADFDRELRPRLIKGGIASVAWIVLVIIFSGFTTSLIISTAILLALYAVPWDMIRYGKWVVPSVAILLAITYPYYRDELYEVPLFGPFPSVDTAVTMTIFIMMAIGLNIVVGYAGLLDLGYVAFYAMGAYTAAWFASPHFGESVGNVHVGSVGVNPEAAGFHVSIWIVLIVAGIFTGIIGILIGLPTLRLRGDYLAIVTLGFGEIMPQIARNGDNLFGTGFNLTNGAQGINPIDPPGFGAAIAGWTGLPEDYLSFDTTFLGREIGGVEVFYWTALGLLLFTVFCSVRLRDSRLGRAWIAIREDETAAAAMGVPLMRTKTWAYAAGRVLRRHRGRLLRELQGRDVPRRLLLQHLGVHPLHGHPRRDGQRLGRDPRRRLPRVPQPGGPREHRRRDQRDLGDEHRRAALPVRHLRPDPRAGHALQARGVDPERTAESRVRTGSGR